MHTIQQTAAQVVCRVMDGRNLNQVLNAALQALPGLSPQDRGALQDLSYGTLRFYGQLTNLLDQLLNKPLQDEKIRYLLLIALYQLHYTKAASHAVVDHAVRAARKVNEGASGLVNAVLRNFLRKQEMLLAIAAKSETSRYSYPQWWIDAVKEQYGERAEAILLTGNLHPPMTLRVNARRSTPAEYLNLLSLNDIPASLIAPDAVLLHYPVQVAHLPGFADGLVSVQDAGAQLAATLLDVHDGMRVLDACSAPGGKSTHLLELAEINLVALDNDEQRLERVRENLQRLELVAQLQTGDAAQPQNWWDGTAYQRILADVPCSASGVVRRHPDIKWLRRAEDIGGFARQQLQILTALWQLLARDGKLLYVTCSVFARENQHVINEFLQHHADARQLPLPEQYLNEGQLLPNDQHDGFFYALLHKPA